MFSILLVRWPALCWPMGYSKRHERGSPNWAFAGWILWEFDGALADDRGTGVAANTRKTRLKKRATAWPDETKFLKISLNHTR